MTAEEPDGEDRPSTEERARRLVRREPPAFRRVEVRSVEPLSPHMRRVRFSGPELSGLAVEQPAASVRLLLPSPGTAELVMPEWNGNEFLLPGGDRPIIRTFTPRRVSGDGDPTLDVDVVLHEGGVASDWATSARPGTEAAVSGPGRGFEVSDGTPYLLAGDESAIPAIGQLLEHLPHDVAVDVRIEVARPDARIELPQHTGAEVSWHDLGDRRHGDALVEAVQHAAIPDAAQVWVAGEAAAVQRIRKHLSDDRGMPRSQTTVRGYWKHGRAGT